MTTLTDFPEFSDQFTDQIQIPCESIESIYEQLEAANNAKRTQKQTKQSPAGMKPTTRSGRPGRKPGRKPKRVLKAAVGKKKPATTPSPLGRRTRAQKAGNSVGELTPAPTNESSTAGGLRTALSAGTSRSSAAEGGPIVSVSRRECFSAAHRLHNPALGDAQNARLYGKCNNKNGHGHNYTVKVTLRGPIDADTGMVYNLADLKEQLKAVLDQLDHKNLDKDVPFFKKNVSTVENIVYFIVVSLREQMDQPQLLHKVKVLETENNAASIVC